MEMGVQCGCGAVRRCSVLVGMIRHGSDSPDRFVISSSATSSGHGARSPGLLEQVCFNNILQVGLSYSTRWSDVFLLVS